MRAIEARSVERASPTTRTSIGAYRRDRGEPRGDLYVAILDAFDAAERPL
jgi:hypothetical protein